MHKKLEEIYHAITQMSTFSKRLRVKLTYSEPVRILKGNYSKKEKTEHILNLGLIRDKKCLLSNRENSRTGWPINHLFLDPIHLDKIIDAEVFQLEKNNLSKEEFLQQEAQKVLNRIHKNLWDNVYKEYEEFIEKGEKAYEEDSWRKAPYALANCGKAKFRSITSVFDDRVLEEIRQAIENKTDYHHSLPTSSFSGKGRDRSVAVKLCDDGILRAWFSSEYPGCGNGDYYLLINPTTALYYERD